MNTKKDNEKLLITDLDVSKAFVEAAIKMSNSVSKTLGPAGSYAIIDQGNGKIRVTKDGVTVAKALNSEDKFESMAIKLIKEVCIKANSVIGDSTTTSITILAKIIEEGHQRLSSKYLPKHLIRGLDKAYILIEKIIKELSYEPSGDDLKNVATISADNDLSLGSLIYEAVKKIKGKYGMITVEDNKSTETELEFTEGMTMSKGYISPYFVNPQNNSKNIIEYDDVAILITNGKINDQNFLLNFLENLTLVGKAGLIICEDIEKNLLGSIILNNYKGIIKVVVVKAPGYGDEKLTILSDIALFTGGKVIDVESISSTIGSSSSSLKSFNSDCLGYCRKISVSKDNTSIIDGKGNKELIQKRIDEIKTKIDGGDLSSYESDKLKEIYSKFVGGVAIIKVGGATESEVNEKKDRVIDSVSSVKSTYDNGIVVGGGLCALNVYKIFEERKYIEDFNESEKEGAKILLEALKAPITQILNNGNFNSDVIINKILESKSLSYGFDALKGEFCDLKERGILDSAKAILTSVSIAVSIGKIAINSKVCISSTNNKSEE